MITGIAHNAVTVRDMKESLCFYTEALGFKKAFEIANPETGAPWIVYLAIAPGQFLELFYDGTEEIFEGDIEKDMEHLKAVVTGYDYETLFSRYSIKQE